MAVKEGPGNPLDAPGKLAQVILYCFIVIFYLVSVYALVVLVHIRRNQHLALQLMLALSLVTYQYTVLAYSVLTICCTVCSCQVSST